MENESKKIYKISKHAKERYAERILGKEDQNEVARYILQNEEKIQTDINKMIEYGKMIFSGIQKQEKAKVINVYSKDTWIVLVDPSNDTVITIFKIDLGAGEDFNHEYISKMTAKIDYVKAELEQIKIEVLEQTNAYRELISDANQQIAEYRAFIKRLEGLNAAYQEIIENNTVRVSQESRKLADVVNTLIGKKEF